MDNVISIRDYLIKKKKVLLAFKYESISERVERIKSSVHRIDEMMKLLKIDEHT